MTEKQSSNWPIDPASLDREVLAFAERAAKASGLSLDRWLDRTILAATADAERRRPRHPGVRPPGADVVREALARFASGAASQQRPSAAPEAARPRLRGGRGLWVAMAFLAGVDFFAMAMPSRAGTVAQQNCAADEISR